jgi:hypothetical protein
VEMGLGEGRGRDERATEEGGNRWMPVYYGGGETRMFG